MNETATDTVVPCIFMDKDINSTKEFKESVIDGLLLESDFHGEFDSIIGTLDGTNCFKFTIPGSEAPRFAMYRIRLRMCGIYLLWEDDFYVNNGNNLIKK